MNWTYIEPAIKLESLTEYLRAAASSKTNELEIVAAQALQSYMKPLIVANGESK